QPQASPTYIIRWGPFWRVSNPLSRALQKHAGREYGMYHMVGGLAVSLLEARPFWPRKHFCPGTSFGCKRPPPTQLCTPVAVLCAGVVSVDCEALAMALTPPLTRGIIAIVLRP